MGSSPSGKDSKGSREKNPRCREEVISTTLEENLGKQGAFLLKLNNNLGTSKRGGRITYSEKSLSAS